MTAFSAPCSPLLASATLRPAWNPLVCTPSIQLPEEREHMRDTIFSAIFGSTVMFDTHDNAHAYQARCKRERNRPLPIIIEEDGSLLVSDVDRGKWRENFRRWFVVVLSPASQG